MPLLPLEPFVFPESLLDAPPDVGDGSARWWALHTRPRAEKVLARRFLGKRLPFFLPLYQRQWRSRGRLLRAYLPLFPGYVFLHGPEPARVAALTTNLVVRCLPVDDQDHLHHDLARVYRLIAAGAPLSPEERLRAGARVEIVSGPLAGMEGVLLKRGQRAQFFVEVQFLQRGVSVELEGWMIRPLANSQQAVACF